MSYKRTPFKMAPKSPLTKALKGNQGKLPQHLQEAIKAAPESPAKAMMGPGVQKEAGKTGTAGANSAKGVNAKKPEFKGSAKMDDAMMGPKAKAKHQLKVHQVYKLGRVRQFPMQETVLKLKLNLNMIKN